MPGQKRQQGPVFISLSIIAVVIMVGGFWLGNRDSIKRDILNRGLNSEPIEHPTTLAHNCGDFSKEKKPESKSSSVYDGMVWVAGGTFTMGADHTYPEEGRQHRETVSGFWMDRHEVTNAEFAKFVTATGYLTLAEQYRDDARIPQSQRVPGSVVFIPNVNDGKLEGTTGLLETWWQFVPGANWRHPQGPKSTITDKEHYPVVHVAYEDALAYAKWKGHALPTEAQFEFAAQSSTRKDANGHHQSNTWQGFFPLQNNPDDGFSGIAPVGCYRGNDYGLYDLIGNVWEWTSSRYYPSHDFPQKEMFPQGFDPRQPQQAVGVIKGGSFLCAANYCLRYRPQARHAQDVTLATSHIGFRTVVNP